MILTDDDGIPYGWESVSFNEEELDEFCDAADDGDIEKAEGIVERAFDRLFGESVS